MHCRPDNAGIISTSHERVTLETKQTASVAAIIKSIENGTPLTGIETTKHLSANVAVAEPSTIQRHLNSSPEQKIKTIESTTANDQSASHTFSMSTKKIASTAKPTQRYHKSYEQNVDSKNNKNRSEHILYDRTLTKHFYSKYFKDKNSLITPNSQSANGTNRQYFGGVFNLNPYTASPSLYQQPTQQPNQWQFAPIPSLSFTTQKPIQAIFIPATTQPTTFYISPNGLITFSETGTATSNVVNIPNPVKFKPNAGTYQLQRPPISSSQSINIPFFDYYSTEPSSLLHLTKNITKLYSIIGSSTPSDPYSNYQKLQTRPAFTKKQVLKIRVTSTQYPPVEHNNVNGVKLTGNEFNQYNNNQTQNSNRHQNKFTELNVQYNESSQYSNKFDNTNNNTVEHFSNHNNNNTQTKTKECSIKANSENICNTNDLNIIIKLDSGDIANATNNNKNDHVKQKKTVTTPTPFFNIISPHDSENEEETEDDYGFGSYIEPIQNVFSFAPGYRARKKKKPQHGMHGMHGMHGDHGNMDTISNKYQTILLQPPRRKKPKKSSTKQLPLKLLFFKLLAFMPILALKPIFFGFWTMVLSPILVIAISGIALGVVLYPWLTISREQVAYASSHRAPKIIYHRHPKARMRPKKRFYQRNPGFRRPIYTKSNTPFLRRRMFDIEPNYSISSSDEIFSNGIRFKKHPQIHLNTFQRSKRRARDTHFQQWLLIQNNFNVRILSRNANDDHYDF